MPHISIAVYKPKPDQDAALRAVLADHMPILLSQGLVTERPSILMKSSGGAYVEVFEWASQEAIQAAHTNPTVLEMWARFDLACTFERLPDLPESSDMFAGFEPVNL